MVNIGPPTVLVACEPKPQKTRRQTSFVDYAGKLQTGRPCSICAIPSHAGKWDLGTSAMHRQGWIAVEQSATLGNHTTRKDRRCTRAPPPHETVRC